VPSWPLGATSKSYQFREARKLSGLNLVLNWPVPGAYNILMDRPALYFGLVLLSKVF
jgi:hypothetical protein